MAMLVYRRVPAFSLWEKKHTEANQRYRSIQSPVHKPLEMANGPLPQPPDPRNPPPPRGFVWRVTGRSPKKPKMTNLEKTSMDEDVSPYSK